MMRSKAVLCALAPIMILFAYCSIGDTRAQSLDAMFNAPGWDLAYDVEFKSNDAGTDTTPAGAITYTRSVTLKSSVTFVLDMRNMGSTLAMLRATMAAGTDSEAAQQAMIDLSMRAETLANWISSGPAPDESASGDEQMAAVMAYMESSKGPGQVQFNMVEKGDNLADEMGMKYSLNRTTTARGAGTVIGPTTLIFEIDAENKTYLLTLAHEFSDKSDSTVLTEVVTVTTGQGGAPETTRKTGRQPLGRLPGRLVINDPKCLVGEIAIMQGEIDPAQGKITGERTVKGYYESGADRVPGTFVFRYTVTPKS